jgi:hypothetical protein
MRRNLTTITVLLFFVSVVSAKPAPGYFLPPPVQSIPQRVLSADTIVVGKVTAVADKTTKAERFKGDVQKGEYRVFTVKIDSAIQGGNGLTHIKVGCLMPAPVAPVVPIGPGPVGGPPGRLARPFPPQQPPMLEKGQEVLLFIRPHISEPFYTVSAVGDVTESKAANFKADVEDAKKVAKMIAEPMTGLKAREASDRYLAAAILVSKYRSAGGPKEEEISADESKLILQGLAGGNWNAPQVGRPGFDPFTPMQMFYILQPQNAGWVQPQNFQEVPTSMKKWLEDNAGKFRIKRFVAVKSE